MADPQSILPLPTQRHIKASGKLLGKKMLVMVGVWAIYLFFGKFGLLLSAPHGTYSPLALASGVGVCAVLIFGVRIWPAILVGSTCISLAAGYTPIISAVFALGDTCEALLAASLLIRSKRFHLGLKRPRDIVIFTVLSAILSPLLSSAMITGILRLSGLMPANQAIATWTNLFLGHGLGILMITPFVLTLQSERRKYATPLRVLESLILFSLLTVVTDVVFSTGQPNNFILLPLVAWVALRFGAGAVAASSMLIACIALWHSSTAQIPLADGSIETSVLWIQIFIAVCAVTGYLLATVLESQLSQQRQKVLLSIEMSARRESESEKARLFNLFTRSPAFVCYTRGPKHLVELINPVAASFFDNRTIEGQTLVTLPRLSDAVANLLPSMQQAYKTGLTVHEKEVEVISGKGSKTVLKYWDFTFAPVFSIDGVVEGLFNFGYEVTAQVLARKKIEETESRFRLMADAAPVLIWISERDRSCSYFNKTYLAFRGRGMSDETGFRWVDGVHPDDQAYCLHTFNTAFDHQTEFRIEYRLLHHSGQYRWILDHGIPRRTPAGEFAGFIGACVDINDQKTAENAVQTSETRLKFALRSARMLAWQWDIVTDTIVHSDGAKQFWGALPKNGEDTYRLIHPDDAPIMKQALQAAIFGNRRYYAQFRSIRPDTGEIQYLEDHGYVEKDADGKPIRISGVMQNITEKKLTENALKRSEDRFKIATDASRVGIWDWDIPSGRWSWIRNQDIIFGPSDYPETTSGTLEDLLARIHSDDKARVKDSLALALRNKASFRDKFRVVWDTGEVRWVLAQGQTLSEGSDQPNRMVGTNLDITDMKRSEDSLRKSEERFKLALDAAKMGTWEFDTKTQTVIWNEYHEKIFGYEPGTPLRSKDDFLDRIHPEDRKRILDESDRCIRTREQFQSQYRVLLPNNDIRWVAADGVFYGEEDSPRFVGVVRDITDSKRAEKALRESEEKFRQLAENIRDVFWIRDVSSRELLYISPVFEEVWCMPLDQFLNDPMRVVASIDREDRQKFLNFLERQLVEECEIEYRIKRPDGQQRWIRDRSFPVRDSRGRIFRVIGIAEDITSQNLAEAALVESEARFRQLSNSMPQIIWTAKSDGAPDYYNDRWFEFTGFPQNDLNPDNLFSILHPDDLAPTITKWRHSVETSEPFLIEYRFWDRSLGNYRWFLGKAVPFYDARKRITKWFGSCTDIDDQKIVQEDLLQSREEFKVMGEAVPYGVWMCSAEGEAQYVSPSFLNLLCMTLDEVKRRGFARRINRKQRVDTYKKWRHCLVTGEPWEHEMCISGGDGTSHYVLSRGRAVRNSQGRIIRWVGINLDIDDRKRVEQALEAAIQSRDAFLSIASHELKTPLTSLKLQAQLHERNLENGSQVTPEKVRRLVSVTTKQVGRLSRLIDDMLDISRIQSGKLSMTREFRDIGELTRDVVDRVMLQLETAGCTVSFASEPRLVCNCDSFRIEQVITNLLTNATRYAPGTLLKVNVRANGTNAQIEVRDQGQGIPKEFHEKIFHRFERVVSPNEVSGLGLGLFIAKKIVEAHKGHIWVESELGKGAAFYVELPLVRTTFPTLNQTNDPKGLIYN